MNLRPTLSQATENTPLLRKVPLNLPGPPAAGSAVRASHRKIRWRGEWHDLMKAQSALLAQVWDNSED
jgi:hypothetical protein